MSDYMFMLENHLSAAQARVVSHLQAAAGSLGFTLFLTGGAMRDMLGGFPIADLDFAVEGNALKMAGLLAASGATILETDEQRRLLELGFPGGVRASAGSARQEHASRPGARPQILQATIHEDLRSRDFTINAIALSLNRGSRGLLLDPNNGLADLGHKELRAITNYTFHDDPVRLLRLLRFRTRLRFSVAQRTWQQYENARQAQLELKIPPPALVQELRSYASEPDPGELLKALAEEGMTQLFSPALSGAKLNLAGFQRLQKARRMVPFGVDFPAGDLGLFLHFLLEKLSPKERSAFLSAFAMSRSDLASWRSLAPKSASLEKELESARLQRPSLLFAAVSKASLAVVLFTFLRTSQRLVQDRIRNYFQKYLPVSQEVSAAEVEAAAGVPAGSAKFEKKRQELIAARLDARPKKVPVAEPEPDPPPTKSRFGMRGGRRGPRPVRANGTV